MAPRDSYNGPLLEMPLLETKVKHKYHTVDLEQHQYMATTPVDDYKVQILIRLNKNDNRASLRKS